LIFCGGPAHSIGGGRRPPAGAAGPVAPGHPYTTLSFVAICWGVVVATFVGHPRQSCIGLGLVLAGLPVYWIWRRRGRRS
jgi:APA family basic amino acid/polyamine antiporter